MADTIDSVFFLNHSNEATISEKVLRRLFDKYDYDLPENCFLRDLHEELDENDEELECSNKKCGTWNESDSKFCRMCGTQLVDNPGQVKVDLLDWSGSDSAETFYKIFVDKVVPHIKGQIVGGLTHGDPDSSDPWTVTFFTINDGEIVFYSGINLVGSNEKPVFNVDEYEEEEDEEEEADEEDDDDVE